MGSPSGRQPVFPSRRLEWSEEPGFHGRLSRDGHAAPMRLSSHRKQRQSTTIASKDLVIGQNTICRPVRCADFELTDAPVRETPRSAVLRPCKYILDQINLLIDNGNLRRAAMSRHIDAVRAFNRFYTQQIGLLDEGMLRT